MDPKLAASVANFAVRFCNEMDQDSSSVCSPVSAQTVLALTALGCAGASRAELLRAMDLTDDDAIRSTFGFITSSLNSIGGVTLSTANRVYVTKNGTLKPNIKKDAKEVFNSGVEQLDFLESNAAARAINKWVAQQTNYRIQRVISPESLNNYTRLVLVNAVYFQGYWDNPFETTDTQDRTFHVNQTAKIKVPTMAMDDVDFYYKYSSALKAKFLRMDYEGRQASMVILLPDKVESIRDVMQQLAAGHDLMEEIAGLRSTPLSEVRIPRFKVETEIDLENLLSKMGIQTIFDKDKSDIRMLTSDRRLFVSRAIQKVVIEVDESGTEAAACTDFDDDEDLCDIDSPPRVKKFIANRPFLYVLTARQIPIFLGVYRGN